MMMVTTAAWPLPQASPPSCRARKTIRCRFSRHHLLQRLFCPVRHDKNRQLLPRLHLHQRVAERRACQHFRFNPVNEDRRARAERSAQPRRGDFLHHLRQEQPVFFRQPDAAQHVVQPRLRRRKQQVQRFAAQAARQRARGSTEAENGTFSAFISCAALAEAPSPVRYSCCIG